MYIKDIKISNFRNFRDASVPFHEGEIPVFWACGVTPQFVVENVKPPIAISHRPGYMFISNILNTEIEEKLAAKEK